MARALTHWSSRRTAVAYEVHQLRTLIKRSLQVNLTYIMCSSSLVMTRARVRVHRVRLFLFLAISVALVTLHSLSRLEQQLWCSSCDVLITTHPRILRNVRLFFRVRLLTFAHLHLLLVAFDVDFQFVIYHLSSCPAS